MSWSDFYKPWRWPGDVKRRLQKDLGGPQDEAERQRKQLLQEQAAKAGTFADYGEGGVISLGGQMDTARQNLLDQATGKLSYSREALRQGLAQNQAAQQSMAAGASPLNSPMAARTAAINMARQGYGLSGQQALAGIAEQQGAAKQYADATLGQRQQDLSAALGSRQTATTGYGAGNSGQPEKSNLEKFGPAIEAALAALLHSDKRLKTDIEPGDQRAKDAMDALVAYQFKYREPDKYGRGEQLGVMAQDLERAGLKQAVIDTPAGKAIDAGKLSGANTAMLASLAKRVADLEGDSEDEPTKRKRVLGEAARKGSLAIVVGGPR